MLVRPISPAAPGSRRRPPPTQIQARYAAIGAEAAAIPVKQLVVDAAVVIDHAQPPLDGQIVVAENIRSLQAEQQDHLRCPDADPLQTA